jgi:hypothetical protein
LVNTNRKLDWAPNHDPRSRNFPIMTLVAPVEPHEVAWEVPNPPLDQGREGACVGFGWTHEALTAPVKVVFSLVRFLMPLGLAGKPGNVIAQWIYKRAQKIDEFPGEAYEGTSVNAGAKVMRSLGLVKEWRWCFSASEVIQALMNGPVVLGIPWYYGMYEAPGGILKVSGDKVGGHCILARAYKPAGTIFPDEAAVGLFNSWGPSWGVKGCAWIRVSELQKLLSDQGEACVPITRGYGR